MNKCPFHTQKAVAAPADWWPDQLNFSALSKDPPGSKTVSKSYAEEIAILDIPGLKADLMTLMTTSQDWWPADYGHYGPLLVRMAWHASGTYRIMDGRGGGGTGNQRFTPLNSWPDNVNLDKARRLLWPIKQKYGRKISWADLMIFSGTCAIELMGLESFGFGFGREDIWEPEIDIYWGPESTWMAAERGGLGDKLENPLGATQMGLIYVNPEGPGGDPDPIAAAQNIRTTFGRMAMNDEETVALIAGGHTFGKSHGAAVPSKFVGPAPEAAPLEEQGLGWNNSFRTGKGPDTIGAGPEGAWTNTPTTWDHSYFQILFKYDWQKTKSPAGAYQWTPKDQALDTCVPDAHDPGKTHAPMMFTTDMSLKMDPTYLGISKHFLEHPKALADAFQRAWYKLTHRDMGPHPRLLGPLVPPPQLWQDPVPPCEEEAGKLSTIDVAKLKAACITVASVEPKGVGLAALVRAAWASASTYRCTDHRGGANGARIRLSPQKDWLVNNPAELTKVLAALETVRAEFVGPSISMADLIVLAGCAAVEAAAQAAGHTKVTVPFSPGRTDATEAMTDASTFAVLEPVADGFRNYDGRKAAERGQTPAETMLVDKAHMLKLSKAEMAALVGGMRVLGANSGQSSADMLTATPGYLNNAFFVNLLDMNTKWVASKERPDEEYIGTERKSGAIKWSASRVDLVFGHNSELRAIAEYYACNDGDEVFVADFIAAWSKVMNLDRFDLQVSAM